MELVLKEIVCRDRVELLKRFLSRGKNQFEIHSDDLDEIFMTDNELSDDQRISMKSRIYCQHIEKSGYRFYAKRVQFIKSEIRDYIFGESSRIDITNCNYSLLWSFATKNFPLSKIAEV